MTEINRELISDVEQFLYREARLLDERKYQQWLRLLTTDVKYKMPARHVPQPDKTLRDKEVILDIDQELSQGLEAPLRDENFMILSMRVMRAFRPNSWTDSPPARTRRFISNVEVMPAEEEGSYQVYSNVLISYSRHQKDNHTFTAQRKDIFRPAGDSFQIAEREVIIDWNVITGPSVGIFY